MNIINEQNEWEKMLAHFQFKQDANNEKNGQQVSKENDANGKENGNENGNENDQAMITTQVNQNVEN